MDIRNYSQVLWPSQNFHDWSPTTHYTTLSRDMVTLVFNIGSRVQVNFGQLIFFNIVDFKSRKKKNQKLLFASLIFGLLNGKKPMIDSHECLTTPI